MLLCIFYFFHLDSERLLSDLDRIFLTAPVIYPTSYTIFYPSLVRKFMGISDFCLFVIMFEFTNRLIVVPLFIITMYLKYDPSFFTCSLQCKLICNPLQILFFVLDTLTYLSLSTFFIPIFFILLVMNLHISCPVRPLIACYRVFDIAII